VETGGPIIIINNNGGTRFGGPIRGPKPTPIFDFPTINEKDFYPNIPKNMGKDLRKAYEIPRIDEDIFNPTSKRYKKKSREMFDF
jgi:hypothetical protein